MSMRNRNKTAKGRKSSRVLAIMMAAVFGLSSLGTALPAYADGDTAQTAEAAQEKAGTASAGGTQQESTSTGKTGEEQPAQDQNSSEPKKQEDTADTQNSAEASSQDQVTSEEPAQEENSEKPAQEETSSEESAQKVETTEESATEETAQEEEQDKAYEQSVTVTEDNGKLTVTAKAAAGVRPTSQSISREKPETRLYTQAARRSQLIRPVPGSTLLAGWINIIRVRRFNTLYQKILSADTQRLSTAMTSRTHICRRRLRRFPAQRSGMTAITRTESVRRVSRLNSLPMA